MASDRRGGFRGNFRRDRDEAARQSLTDLGNVRCSVPSLPGDSGYRERVVLTHYQRKAI